MTPDGEAFKKLLNVIDIRMNNYLAEMKPDHDDSITGFNEAWDIVREALEDAIRTGSVIIRQGEEVRDDDEPILVEITNLPQTGNLVKTLGLITKAVLDQAERVRGQRFISAGEFSACPHPSGNGEIDIHYEMIFAVTATPKGHG